MVDRTQDRTGRVAVIGGGVSGLTAALALAHSSEVTLYEAQARLGGHADTHRITATTGASIGVDTGFIVHNDRTYPTLLRLFDELGVATQESDMSMSVRCDGCGLEYAGARGLAGLFATPRSVTRGRYLRLLTEVPRFHRLARAELDNAGSEGRTLGEFVGATAFSDYFVTHFLTPLVSAVWSCDPTTALRYPARYLFAFLHHHGMLTVFGSPTWRTVVGGSANYVAAVAERLDAVRVAFGSTDSSVCRTVWFTEYGIADRIERSASVGSASRARAWAGWGATTTASKCVTASASSRTATPSAVRCTARTGVATRTASNRSATAAT